MPNGMEQPPTPGRTEITPEAVAKFTPEMQALLLKHQKDARETEGKHEDTETPPTPTFSSPRPSRTTPSFPTFAENSIPPGDR